MRGIYTPVTAIRRQVFARIAKLAYEGGDFSRIEEIPYKIVPGEIARYRDSVFKERAIVGERLRLACGLDVRPADVFAPISKGIDISAISEKYYQPPLVNVIPFACNSCDEKKYEVTDGCQGCLASPCINICPVKAVSMVHGHSVIDQARCIKCGRCKDACPYSAIIKAERPCAQACGVNAIESDNLGRAVINQEKCVSCGQCLVNCPFGAIADKSQIFQLIHAIKDGKKIIAEIAPAFVGQFGPLATPNKIKQALKLLGLFDMYEVAIGADLGAVEEAHHYVHEVVSGQQPFLATSCCPSWSMLAKQYFPTLAPYVSQSLTPMVATARIIKEEHPDAMVVFIGPCSSKKLEASRHTVRSDVDFVITFEELMGMFVAKEIDFGDLITDEMAETATASGRGYAVAGGVADAIGGCIRELYPEVEFKIDRAEGLANCKKMLALAKAGKRDGYLMEGMACPNGCIGGAGTIMPIVKAAALVKQFQEEAKAQVAVQSPYVKEHE